jgi:hypothetical protein
MARPCKVIDPEGVRRLARIGCSQAEIGEALGCSDDTLRRRFAASIKKGYAELNVSLRRSQVRAAQAGNVTMLIWLGKQRLGQKNEPRQTKGSDRLRALMAAALTGATLSPGALTPAAH